MLSLIIALQKQFRWFRRLQLWATGDQQLHHDNMPAHASRLMQSFQVKHHNTQVTQPCYSSYLVPCDFWLFPKLKSPSKEKRYQIVDEIQKYDRAADSDWENCVRSQRCLLWSGLRYHCPMYNVSCIFFNKCLYFSYYVTGYFLDRPLTYGVYICKRTQ